MTQAQIVQYILQEIQNMTPYDTGNLHDSTKLKYLGNSKWEIYVNCGEDPYLKDYERGLAPYMPFVNEKWISPRWRGKQNPNENYWNKSIEIALYRCAKRFEGELKKWN